MAFDSDTNSIFDRYVNKVLEAVTSTGVDQPTDDPEEEDESNSSPGPTVNTTAPGPTVNTTISPAKAQPNTAATPATNTNSPLQLTQNTPPSIPITSNEPIKLFNTAKPGADNINIAGGPVKLTPSGATQAPTNNAPITPKEQELIKKLHNSDYNPNSSTDRARLQELRNAVTQVGNDTDINKIASAAYAQQYNKSAGNKAATPVGVDTGKPGAPTGTRATPPPQAAPPDDSVRYEAGRPPQRKSKYGGAMGSLSNFLGDVGNTLTGKSGAVTLTAATPPPARPQPTGPTGATPPPTRPQPTRATPPPTQGGNRQQRPLDPTKGRESQELYNAFQSGNKKLAQDLINKNGNIIAQQQGQGRR